MHDCPACGLSYPDDAKFCPMDATRLPELVAVKAPEPVDLREPEPPGPWKQALATEIDQGVILDKRFLLDREFQETPTGQLHQAIELRGVNKVLVKLVSAATFPSPMLVDRTLRELRQLPRVTSPYVMKVLSQGKTPAGDVYVVFTPPPTSAVLLDEFLQRTGTLAPDRARAIVQKVGEALAAAHQSGVVHRNIAPHTIYVSEGAGGDEVLVVDFALPEVHEINGRIVQGSPYYLSPEQAEGKSVDQRSNIYSLGAIYYYLLTGTSPHTGRHIGEVLAQVTGAPAPPASRLRPGLPPALDNLISKALEKGSARRHLTLRHFLNELDELGSMSTPSGGSGEVRPYRSATRTMIMGAESIFAPLASGRAVSGPLPAISFALPERPVAASGAPVVKEISLINARPLSGQPARTLVGFPSVVSGRAGRVTPTALAAAFSGGQGMTEAPTPASADLASQSIRETAVAWRSEATPRPAAVESYSPNGSGQQWDTLVSTPAATAVAAPDAEAGHGPEAAPGAATALDEYASPNDGSTIPMPRMSEAELMATFGLEVPLLRSSESSRGTAGASDLAMQAPEPAPPFHVSGAEMPTLMGGSFAISERAPPGPELPFTQRPTEVHGQRNDSPPRSGAPAPFLDEDAPIGERATSPLQPPRSMQEPVEVHALLHQAGATFGSAQPSGAPFIKPARGASVTGEEARLDDGPQRPQREAANTNKGMRETAWFKRGEIEDELEKAKAEITVTAEDRERLSLKSGHTGQHPTVTSGKNLLGGKQMTDSELIDEMRGKSKLIIAAIVALVLAGLVILGWTLFHA